MSHECPVCGELRGNGKCSNCGYDPLEDQKDDREGRGFAFDGGTAIFTQPRLENCPDCGRMVNRWVTGRRCPYCRDVVFEEGSF